MRFLLVDDLDTQRAILDWAAEDCRFDDVTALPGRPEPEPVRSVTDVQDAAGDRQLPLGIHHRHLHRIAAFLLGRSVVVDRVDHPADAVVGAAALR